MMSKHTTEVEQQPQHDSETILKWYLDPRVWLFAVGVLCWVLGSYFDLDQTQLTKP
jgi:hypothetical protein